MQTKRYITAAVAAAALAVPGVTSAQGAAEGKAQKQQTFDEWLEQINSDFDAFQDRISKHYADFLRGEWHPYEALEGMQRYSTPKPSALPTAPGAEAGQSGQSTPALVALAPETKETNSLYVAAGASAARPIYDLMMHRTLAGARDVMARKQQQEADRAEDAKHSVRIFGSKNVESFNFYGLTVDMPVIDFALDDKLAKTTDFATQWNRLDSERVPQRVAEAAAKLAEKMNLNDFLTYLLVQAYFDDKCAQADATSRAAAAHQVLVNMNYDARIALSEDGEPLLMIPAQAPLYNFHPIERDGRRFYIMKPGGEVHSGGRLAFYTCDLPQEATQGKTFDMVVGELRLPEDPVEFYLANGMLTLQGEVNSNLFPLLYRYPNMAMEGYARSCIAPGLRQELVGQVREQLEKMDETGKVNTLLNFMHYGFDYASDQDQHGFEKPYFVEENLFYPNNDCEDRALFYSWLVHEALGLDSQVIEFPGHEAATVKMSTSGHGVAYECEEGRFYISDPTYRGSKTGMIIDEYEDELPEIDYTFM